ncbi:MAG: thioredoxin [bacterium]|jgi:thioredoxin 1
MTHEITSEQFEGEVIKSTLPVLVDFSATWCPPCKMLEPVIERLSKEYEGKLKVIKINTDNSPDLATRYQIRGVPTMMFFKNGLNERTIVGYRDYDRLKEELELIL